MYLIGHPIGIEFKGCLLSLDGTKKIAIEQGVPKKEFLPEAIALLQEYDWTGNIRELRNIVERLIILGGQDVSVGDVNLFASK